MGPTHRLVGGSTALALGALAEFPWFVVAGAAVVSTMASTFPDDVERPVKIGRRRKLTIWPGFPHRQITHYPVVQLAAVFLVATGLAALSPLPDEVVLYLAGALAIAFVMHSVADAMTVDRRGIALLWPVQRRGYHLLPRSLRASVGSNSPSETVFAVAWVLFVLCLLYARFRSNIPS